MLLGNVRTLLNQALWASEQKVEVDGWSGWSGYPLNCCDYQSTFGAFNDKNDSVCATAFSLLNFRAICEIVSHISAAKNSTDLQPNYNYRTKPPNIVKYVDPFDL